MNNIKPYVYRCENKITNEFYFGYRYANIHPAHLDLGIHYFTSSNKILSNFYNYDYEILAEYDNREWAYEVEQRLIYEHRHNPLLLNENFKRTKLISLSSVPTDSSRTKLYEIINKSRIVLYNDDIDEINKLFMLAESASFTKLTRQEKWWFTDSMFKIRLKIKHSNITKTSSTQLGVWKRKINDIRKFY